MKSKQVKVDSPINIKLALVLIAVGYIGMPIFLALPLLIFKAFGISLVQKIGLSIDNFYVFILISSALSLLLCSTVIAAKLRAKHLSLDSIGFRRVSIRRSLKYVIGFPIAILMFTLLVTALLQFVGIDMSEKNSTTQAILGPLWATIPVTVLFAPFVEEVLFRGILLQNLLSRMNAPLAIILSGLLFAISHVDPVHMIMVLPLGLYLGYTYYRLKSVWPGIFIHMGWNLLVALAMT